MEDTSFSLYCRISSSTLDKLRVTPSALLLPRDECLCFLGGLAVEVDELRDLELVHAHVREDPTIPGVVV